VPSFGARTHEEWTEWNNIWPLKPTKLPLNLQLFDMKVNNLKENQSDDYITNLKLTKQQVQDAEKYIQITWYEAERAKELYNNVVSVAAVIVRPGKTDTEEDEIIARAFDRSPLAISP
jgi:hypothetical protein